MGKSASLDDDGAVAAYYRIEDNRRGTWRIEPDRWGEVGLTLTEKLVGRQQLGRTERDQDADSEGVVDAGNNNAALPFLSLYLQQNSKKLYQRSNTNFSRQTVGADVAG